MGKLLHQIMFFITNIWNSGVLQHYCSDNINHNTYKSQEIIRKTCKKACGRTKTESEAKEKSLGLVNKDFVMAIRF